MKGALVALGATIAVLALVRPFEPYSWGHRLSEGCQWLPVPAQQAFGREYLDTAAKRAELACWRRHGAKAFSMDVREVVSRWPDAAQLAAWNEEDAK